MNNAPGSVQRHPLVRHAESLRRRRPERAVQRRLRLPPPDLRRTRDRAGAALATARSTAPTACTTAAPTGATASTRTASSSALGGATRTIPKPSWRCDGRAPLYEGEVYHDRLVPTDQHAVPLPAVPRCTSTSTSCRSASCGAAGSGRHAGAGASPGSGAKDYLGPPEQPLRDGGARPRRSGARTRRPEPARSGCSRTCARWATSSTR